MRRSSLGRQAATHLEIEGHVVLLMKLQGYGILLPDIFGVDFFEQGSTVT
jgi:hypothetical protein